MLVLARRSSTVKLVVPETQVFTPVSGFLLYEKRTVASARFIVTELERTVGKLSVLHAFLG